MNDNAPASATPMLTQAKPRPRRLRPATPTPARAQWLDAGDAAWLAVWLVPGLLGVVALLSAP
jgi:hypothetical protein